MTRRGTTGRGPRAVELLEGRRSPEPCLDLSEEQGRVMERIHISDEHGSANSLGTRLQTIRSLLLCGLVSIDEITFAMAAIPIYSASGAVLRHEKGMSEPPAHVRLSSARTVRADTIVWVPSADKELSGTPHASSPSAPHSPPPCAAGSRRRRRSGEVGRGDPPGFDRRRVVMRKRTVKEIRLMAQAEAKAPPRQTRRQALEAEMRKINDELRELQEQWEREKWDRGSVAETKERVRRGREFLLIDRYEMLENLLDTAPRLP